MTILTLEEEAILRPEYDKYCAKFYKWQWKNDEVMSFDEWWRSAADEAKDRAKYEPR